MGGIYFNPSNGRHLFQAEPSMVIQTDASTKGWGAHSQGLAPGGEWSQKEGNGHKRRDFAHQYLGTSSSVVCNSNVYKKFVIPFNSLANWQQNSGCLPFKNRGYSQQAPYKYKQIDLAIPHSSTDHDYCRVHPEQIEHQGRLAVKEPLRLVGLEIGPTHIPENIKINGDPNSRPICIPPISPSYTVHSLKTRSRQHCNRCDATTLGKSTGVCLLSVW